MQEFEIEFDNTSHEFGIDMSDKIIELKPTLEDLEVTPTTELQEFKPVNSIGFERVVVNPMPKQKYKPNSSTVITFKNSTEIDMSHETGNLDTTNLKTFKQMFYYNNKTEFYDFSGWNTSNCEDMSNMFEENSRAKKLDLSSFTSEKLKTTSSMFRWCSFLEYIDLRNFIFTNIPTTNGMFYRVPNNCLIIVKDEEQKQFVTTNFSNLTNIKTVAEYEAESQ